MLRTLDNGVARIRMYVLYKHILMLAEFRFFKKTVMWLVACIS